MQLAKPKRTRETPRRVPAKLNGKAGSFRDLKAFGLWADRAEANDPVKLTQDIRKRMEHGADAR